MAKIPFLDLGRGSRVLWSELTVAIGDVLESGQFILGSRVEEFERQFSVYCGAVHGIGVSSGTEALRLAMQACGVGPGDEVLTVSHTCVPTVAAITSLGAVPVCVDIETDTYTIDPSQLEARVTTKTKAIVPVHLYGQCADMDPILTFAREYGLRVIEDCAQAHGARDAGRVAGTMGDAGCYSFYPTKNLGAVGDAGMVVTNDGAIAERVKWLRNYGQTDRAHHELKGDNGRLDELQAAVLSVKLGYLERWTARRRAIAQAYAAGLVETPIGCPTEAVNRFHVYHLYVVRVSDRGAFQEALARQGIETLVHYPVPVHRQPAYSELLRDDHALEVTNRMASEIVSLPMYPELEDSEVEQIITAVQEWAASIRDAWRVT